MSGFIITEKSLRHALDRGDIQPAFQPVILAPQGKLVGLEVLARWYLSDGRAVPPEEFIKISSRCGLEAVIAKLLMESTAPTACRLSKKLMKPLIIGFNAGPTCLVDPVFEAACVEFNRICSGHGISLAVEVTEREPLSPEIKEYLKQLQNIGATLVLDDYGSGYSKADVLTWMKPQILKLDRSLTMLAGDNQSAIKLSRLLKTISCSGAQVLAEGVENKKEYDWFFKHGVRLFQGYFFSHPLSAEMLETNIKSRTFN